MDFTKRYNSLNDKQKQAVDTIYGPLLVLAGPGTGKTELLSVRIANILDKTDVSPENILCLTFTDSGSSAMSGRLFSIIGKDAYKVAVHTFHSFCSEIMNKYSEFFYNGANFHLSDDLTRRELLIEIIDGLDYSNPLKKTMNGEYTYISDIETTISELKRSGFTNDEVLLILDSNEATIQVINNKFGPVFANRISAKMVDTLKELIPEIKSTAKPTKFSAIVPLADIFVNSLEIALESVATNKKTTDLTSWKNNWFEKNDKNQFVLKSTSRQEKMRAMCLVYETYLNKMQEKSMYDFDDMILRTLHALEVFPDLRYNLQEQFQFILVDEFQDTNMAQMRILSNLTDYDNSPNIMAVGDDDQAIYSFQGADISNVLEFTTKYKKAKIITLNDNYRSTKNILDLSRNLITQGKNRLESQLEFVNKELNPNKNHPGNVKIFQAQSTNDERSWLVSDISKKINNGQDPSSIAVIVRKHAELEKLLPHFAGQSIEVNYEKYSDVLKQQPIESLILLSKFILYLDQQKLEDASSLLPEIFSHPAWNIDPKTLLQISIDSYSNHKLWISSLLDYSELADQYNWLIETAKLSKTEPLENILDRLIGKTDIYESTFSSPYFKYYFGEDKLNSDPEVYIRYIKALFLIRRKLREYSTESDLRLKSFIEYLMAYQKTKKSIYISEDRAETKKGVNLLTAHKSKGLEFEVVYVVDSTEATWGQKSRSKSRMISYPENLPIADAGNSFDEKLRLYYVAATRAKNELILSYARNNDTDKSSEIAGFLVDSNLDINDINTEKNTDESQKLQEILWYEPLIKSKKTLKEVLAPTLENYQLSVTHLTQFLDVTRGGPKHFLIKNLLRFPEAMSPASAYGSAVHDTLNLAHIYIKKHGQKQALEDITNTFEKELSKKHLSTTDYNHYLNKGINDIRVFLEKNYTDFNESQESEISFKKQGVVIGGAKLTGKIDILTKLDNNNIEVGDYKTGKPIADWKPKTDYDKIKLYHYKQQLLFYKILLNNSRDYHKFNIKNGKIYFIEPNRHKESICLSYELLDDEIKYLSKLIEVVYRKIIDLDLADTSHYPQNLAGIKQFEQDLLDTID